MSVVDSVIPERATRFVEFCGVGAVGMAVDLAITFALLGRLDPVVANAAGFAVAVTHNFAGNWWLTFDRPEGSLGRQYVSYVGLHSVTFGVRAVVLTGVLAATALPATVATVVGVGAAAIANYLGTETIFGGDGSLWFSVVEAANHLAHAVYRSPIRRLLLATGLYSVVFRAYAWGLHRAHPADTRTIEAGDATAEVAIETPTETVSVLHTLEKEGAILEQFAADVRPDDRVVDIGANVGVYSAVASAHGAAVTAVEPHPPTVERLWANCPDADICDYALGAEWATVQLGVTNDAAGTQRPAVGDGSEYIVRQAPADHLLVDPDVVKIDVEGAELDVLNGATGWLREQRPRVWWIETHDGRAAAVRDVLARHGYAVEVVREGDTETYLRATDDAGHSVEGQEDTNA